VIDDSAAVYPEYAVAHSREDWPPFNLDSIDAPWRSTSEWNPLLVIEGLLDEDQP